MLTRILVRRLFVTQHKALVITALYPTGGLLKRLYYMVIDRLLGSCPTGKYYLSDISSVWRNLLGTGLTYCFNDNTYSEVSSSIKYVFTLEWLCIRRISSGSNQRIEYCAVGKADVLIHHAGKHVVLSLTVINPVIYLLA